MKDRPFIPQDAGGCRDLQRAARIGRGDHVRRERGDVACFTRPQLSGGLWLDQVIDSGAPTADLGFGRCQQLDAGNRLQERARLRPDALAVRQMAGVVVGDGRRRGDGRRVHQADCVEELGHVTHARCKGPG